MFKGHLGIPFCSLLMSVNFVFKKDMFWLPRKASLHSSYPNYHPQTTNLSSILSSLSFSSSFPLHQCQPGTASKWYSVRAHFESRLGIVYPDWHTSWFPPVPLTKYQSTSSPTTTAYGHVLSCSLLIIQRFDALQFQILTGRSNKIRQ